ncbi:M55 family metallopeptidase (plasmid) [Nonomuraea sp. NBC_00507]|uniref:M55 family metallopeptidase n=1 Tax=Nonomuraea sp. NBC_00507 TaxID=2976002 RepID=UPI002E18C9BB
MVIKVLISVDMEGIAGIVHPAETTPERYDYERGRRLMTAAANAVVEGVIDTEPAAEVLVADSHGPYRNILPEDLDRRARLIRGKPRELGMLAGLQAGAQVVMFVGYHARAGASGVLAHTIADAILDVRINGRSHGEIGINTLLAGSCGASVVLASGDDAACEEFSALVPGGIIVPVKRGLGQHAADSLHPQEANDRLRQSAGQAIRRHGEHRPVAVPRQLGIEVDLHQPRSADLAALIPGIARTGRTVTFTAEDMTAAYGMLQLLALLTHIGP